MVRSLEADKHVLCEKPLVLSKAEAEKVFLLAEAKGKVLLEALKTAFLPAFRRVTGVALSGSIGEVKYIDATFTKLVNGKTRELDPLSFGGSVTELASYVLLPFAKILGESKWSSEVSFVTWKPENSVDLWTSIQVMDNKIMGMGKVGLGVKAEGALVIGGSKGYIYVPAPWWKTSNFEIRKENPAQNKLISESFEGEGLRYEIAEFVKLVLEGRLINPYLMPEESIWFAEIIQRFLNGKGVRQL